MGGRLRILLVDDNPQDRRLVVHELHKVYPQAEIVEAVNQQQLDQYNKAGRFDVVVTDYHLRWSDGITVLQAIKARDPDCPVIMFTGTGSEEIAVEAMKNGLDDYIIKNVKHLVRLSASVQAALEHAATRVRAQQLESRLQTLLSQLEVGAFSCLPDGEFVELNDAMLRILNCRSAEQAARLNLAALFASESEASLLLDRIVESGLRQESEIELRYPDGSSRCYRVNTTPVFSAGRRVSRIDGLVEDVTRRRQSEAKAKAAAVASAQIAMLSPREKQVLDLVVAGNANKVIARRMAISEKTVEKHRASVMKKMGVRSVAELVRRAMMAESSQQE